MDEAADALMTRLGFLLGDKIITGEAGSSYHGQDDGQVISKCRRIHTYIPFFDVSLLNVGIKV